MEKYRAIPKGYMTVGQLAKKMGVTVRALQHYDKQGFFSPSAESEGGRRLYTDKDLVLLHQILSLKHLGFSLEDIKSRVMPLESPTDVAKILTEQAADIQRKLQALLNAYEEIELLKAEVLQMQSVDFKKYADIVVNIQMKNQHYWLIKHFDEQTLNHARGRFDKNYLHQKGVQSMQKIGIICAGADELAPFLPCIENVVVHEKAMLRFYEGQIKGVEIVALYSGVCKVNAALATQILIDTYRVTAIINAGTAGGVERKIDLFDTVISTQAAYHDVDDGVLTEFHPWLPSIYFSADKDLLDIARGLFAQCPNIYFGRMVTGEKFIEDNMLDKLKDKYSPLSVDMETASVAHVCHVNSVPFIAIRSITDTPTHSGIENFEKNCLRASIVAKDITLVFLEKLATFIK